MDDEPETPNCNEMLLQAVRTSNVEEVERWLHHPNLDVKYNIGGGDTILFESIRVGHELIFLSLLNAGFEVNAMNEIHETPLGRAVHSSANNFAHELLKRGADMNTPSVVTYYSQHLVRHYTPLKYALLFEKLDTVSLLLYYGADANPVCIRGETYLMYAIQMNNFKISKILLNYQDDLSTKSWYGTTALELAIQHENPIAFDILNLVTNENECFHSLMLACLPNRSNEIFKLILFKYEKESNLNEVFLLNYLFRCRFPNSEWVECLHLLLTVAKITPLSAGNNRCGEIFVNLLRSVHRRQLELPVRISLIYLFLSYDVVITYPAVNLAYLLYGFNEELEAFLYAFSYKQSYLPTNFLPVPKFIFTLEDDFSICSSLVFESLINDFSYYVIFGKSRILWNAVLKSVGFCSLSGFQKRAIRSLCSEHIKNIEHIVERLAATPEFPSLVELSRNQTRKFIKQQYNIRKPYQFLAIVKGLNLPVYIKDVICFKTAIY